MSGLLMYKSGKTVNPFCLRYSDVCIEDIAHGLARQNRFNGQTRFELPVAQHSVEVYRRVCELTPDPYVRGWALLHDASETYLGDWPRPIREHVFFGEYRIRTVREVEIEITNVVFRALGLPATDMRRYPWDIVQRADDEMLQRELTVLLRQPSPHAWCNEPIYYQTAKVAEDVFLANWRLVKESIAALNN